MIIIMIIVILPFMFILSIIIISKIGARDTAIQLSSNYSENEMIEFFWDIILLTESKFILPFYSNSRNFKSLQKLIVKNIGNLLNSLIHERKLNSSNLNYHWRKLGTRYTLVYLPLFFKDLIWCKSDSIYFHVILPQVNEIDDSSTTQLEKKKALTQNSKEWLLALLELAESLNLTMLRLYINRTDIDNISTLLRNLNWIGGKLVPNEDRSNIQSNDNDNCNEFNEFMLGDEHFVIIEFEC
ncbi:hypothetical protein Kpol_333p1 [Vanderwaltozyma polyspora DSM 70294]|uniref:Uncharacterized protein n=1 Tax=Vanderwaltozyma polyspora (strain ATCC 22028 / DSM 70294 / BCRC 21397 / CBS 2163 / NBRC 10782 / NRRL Y-8283 / UCD 57-17) TaxID=436907 RepID=A7TSL8_VANPO|nr:uncharacterized protein Kpol_333p1 [Vanderwaltozyma polyspora DSM 70294]EDO14731.1 hypothetical protein Kpol_333p1 [Vanderwaltozyma polyspora DSM 70294]